MRIVSCFPRGKVGNFVANEKISHGLISSFGGIALCSPERLFKAERSGQSCQSGTGARLRRHRQGYRWRAEKSRESLKVCALIETPVGLIECEFKPSFPNPMNNDELRELNKRRKIHQIAWVTRD